MSKVLVLYATSDGQTKKVAEFIARTVGEEGSEAECIKIKKAKDSVSLEHIDAVIIGASIHADRYKGFIKKFVRNNIEKLSLLPTAFFTVCLTAKSQDEESKAKVESYVQNFLTETSLKPVISTGIAGAILYKEYSMVKRVIMKKINESVGGDADTSRNYEYTDWDAVRNFVKEFLIKIK